MTPNGLISTGRRKKSSLAGFPSIRSRPAPARFVPRSGASEADRPAPGLASVCAPGASPEIQQPLHFARSGKSQHVAGAPTASEARRCKRVCRHSCRGQSMTAPHALTLFGRKRQARPAPRRPANRPRVPGKSAPERSERAGRGEMKSNSRDPRFRKLPRGTSITTSTSGGSAMPRGEAGGVREELD